MKLKIISEIGVNHNGDFRLIEELIRQSALGGADFAKFQLYDSKRVFGDNSRKKNEFTFSQVDLIKKICDAYNIEFFASVFDEEKLEWCNELKVNYFKIASRTLVNEPELCKKIISTNVNTFASLGFFKSNLDLPHINKNVKYFNCVSKYPTSILDHKNCTSRHYDKKVVGLSDHSYGIANCLYHITRGASYIEKHFTIDKSMPGNDHIGSMDLADLKKIREIGDELLTLHLNCGKFV